MEIIITTALKHTGAAINHISEWGGKRFPPCLQGEEKQFHDRRGKFTCKYGRAAASLPSVINTEKAFYSTFKLALGVREHLPPLFS